MVILMIITIFNLSYAAPMPGWGGLPYETDGDAHCLTLGCKFWILVSLRVFQAQHTYIKPPRNTELREETEVKFCF